MAAMQCLLPTIHAEIVVRDGSDTFGINRDVERFVEERLASLTAADDIKIVDTGEVCLPILERVVEALPRDALVLVPCRQADTGNAL